MTLKATLGGLRIKLVLLTLLALLPLGLIALWQTFRDVEATREINHQFLMAITATVATDQRNAVQRAVGAGAGLGALALATDVDTCRAGMADFLARDDTYAFAGYIPLSGLMVCSSDGDTVIDFSDYPALATAVERGSVYVEVNADGAVSGVPVVIVSVPIRQNGALQGFVALSLPQSALQSADDLSVEGAALIAIGTTGIAFALSDGQDDVNALLPAGVGTNELFDRVGTTFVGPDQSGQSRVFSVTGAVEDSYVVLGSWPQADVLQSAVWSKAAVSGLFAVLMWGASMLVAYLGLNRLVLRHLRALRSAMRKFALGERSTNRLELEDAPDEFKEAERAFNRMTLLITEAEARQLTDLHDKEVLLREVHHRVKNNLQMIASIMNLQLRSARTAEAREMLGGLQRRVRALAMLHRTLLTEFETSQVDARDLLSTVVSESSALVPSDALEIRTELASVMIYPDQAVPLSMWASESVTNAVKYAGYSGSDTPFIAVTLTHDGAGALVLKVENSTGPQRLVPPVGDVEGTGLGSKLMNAFCRQLEAEADARETDGTFVHTLRFGVQGFASETENDKTSDHVAA